MREILYRGKRKDNDEWVYGYYCRCGWTGMEKDVIIPSHASALYGIDVIPETVGQYTGLTDKNGKKIFEGDILRIVGWYFDVIYRNGGFVWRDMRLNKFVNYANSESNIEQFSFVEVIGNIHSSHEKRIYEKCIYEDFNKKAEV